MAVRVDPENNETRALLALLDFSGKRVLEIGCGDGRLTWRYADRAEHVTAIDPKGDAIARARENLPEELKSASTIIISRLKTFLLPVKHQASIV